MPETNGSTVKQVWITQANHRKHERKAKPWTAWEDFEHVRALMSRPGGIVVQGPFDSNRDAQLAARPSKLEFGEPDMLDLAAQPEQPDGAQQTRPQKENMTVYLKASLGSNISREFESVGFTVIKASEGIAASAPRTEERAAFVNDFQSANPDAIEEVYDGVE